jgi:hypothetical protein
VTDLKYQRPPNPRKQRTPSAPLMRKPLGDRPRGRRELR